MKTSSKIRKKVGQSGTKGRALFEFGRNAGKQQKGVKKNITQRRAEAERQRKKTIGVELRNQWKRGEFRDERIGQKNDSLTEEDRLIARLKLQHSKRSRKKAVFNLEDEFAQGQDVLTHGGTAIDDFSDDELNDNADDDLDSGEEREAGLTSAEGTELLNFGGGFVKRDNVDEVDDEGRPKTHAEVMAEIIAKSKMHRDAKAKEKLEMEKKVEELDAQLKEIIPSIAMKARPPINLKESEADKEFDRAFVELTKEKRAVATERLKTPEEQAKEEQERLAELEAKRQRRMKGDEDESSAEEEEDRRMGGDDVEENFDLASNGDEEAGSDDSNSGSEDEGGVDAPRKTVHFGEMEESEDKSDVDDGLAPIIEIEDDSEIPFTFKSCPATYPQLMRLFKNRNSRQRKIVLERLVKNFAVPLNPVVNKPLQATLLKLILHRFTVISRFELPSWDEIGECLPLVFDMAGKNTDILISWARTELDGIHKRLMTDGIKFSSVGRGGLLILRILCRLFPTSDMRHPITTPATLLLAEVFAYSPVETASDMKLSCYAMPLFGEYLISGGRVCGELVRFCASVIACYFKSDTMPGQTMDGHILPAHRDGAFMDESKWPEQRVDLHSISLDTDVGPVDFRTNALFIAVEVCYDLAKATAKAGNVALSATFESYFSALSISVGWVGSLCEGHHDYCYEFFEKCQALVDSAESSREPLTFYAKAVTAPKALNPRFGPRNPRSEAAEKDKVKKLKRELRREERGASRELRKDASFINRERIKDAQKESERREKKTRDAMVFLEQQERTWKQQEKKKRRESGKW